MEIPLQEFERAAQRLKGVLHHTELDLSATFSAMTGGNIYLKYENSQKTGSFKIRGASNKIAALVERGETGAVVASSAGNHAQAWPTPRTASAYRPRSSCPRPRQSPRRKPRRATARTLCSRRLL